MKEKLFYSNNAIRQFVKEHKQEILEAQSNFGGCYLAVIDMGDTWEIELEINEGTIAGNFTSEMNLRKTRQLANSIEAEIFRQCKFCNTGCKVFHTRKQWEKSWEVVVK